MSAPISKYFKLEFIYPPVAQPDNAADSDSEERGFESLRAGHLFYFRLAELCFRNQRHFKAGETFSLKLWNGFLTVGFIYCEVIMITRKPWLF